MKNSSFIVSLLFLLLALPLYFLWPSDEGRIRKLFKDGAKAIEVEDLEAVMSKVSYNYRDDYGHSYLYLKENLKRQFEDFSDIQLEYEVQKLQIKERSAIAEVSVRAVATIGNETGYILGDVKDPAFLRFALEKERTKWLIARTERVE